VPPEIAAVVHRLMEKDPERRYPVPAALAEVLEVWLADRHGSQADATPTGLAATNPSLHDLSAQTARPVEQAAAELAPEVPAPRPPLGLSRFPMPTAIVAAVGVGLLVAWAVRQKPEPAGFSVAPGPEAASERPAVAGYFALASAPNVRLARLDQAVLRAGDGDVITVHGDGLFAVAPFVVHGKSLTIRAAEGGRPRFAVAPGSGTQAWHPLIWTDAALTLEGIDLDGEPGRPQPGPAHLLYSQGAPLKLIGCRIGAAGVTSPVVCRGARCLELRDCSVTARASAVSVELGAGRPPELLFAGNTIEVQEGGGAALALWAGSAQPADLVSLRLEHNRFRAGRVLAVAGLTSGVDVLARDNVFSFREAVVSFAGYPGTQSWRQAVRWQGRDNRYQGRDEWLRVEGGPGGVRGLADWSALWQESEPGSREDPPARPVTSAPADGAN
jgi:hypothetical protein